MGTPAWQNPELEALIDLATTPAPGWLHRIRGLDYYNKAATVACGATIAHRSLLALIWFPQCQIPCAPQFAFVTSTRKGWYLWTSYRV
jgi:hypothetical protein